MKHYIPVETLEPRLVMAAGDLDFTFAADGTTTAFLTNKSLQDTLAAVALQPDGKIIAAGSATDGNSRYFPDFAVARFNADGSIDSTFGSDGQVLTDFGPGLDGKEEATAVTVQADGKIVVAGFAGSDFAIVRYNSNGSVDTGFGTGGKVLTDFGGQDRPTDLVVRPDGTILVAGSSDGDVALAAYTSGGVLDAGFGGGGKIKRDLGGGDAANALTLQADGKIIMAGTNGNDAMVLRYGATGIADATFGVNGLVLVDFGAASATVTGLAIQGDGRIVLGGGNNQGALVARLNADGTLDSAFGTGGKMVGAGGANFQAASLELLSDGKLVVAGSKGVDFGAVRFTSAGQLDATFGTAGVFSADIGQSIDYARDTVLLPSGAIVLVGSTNNDETQDGALVQITIAGTTDSAFSSDGIATIDFKGGSDIFVGDVAAQSDGKVVVVGGTSIGYAGADFFVKRFNVDGSLDATFGAEGQVITDFQEFGNIAQAVGVQPDGKIVVAGNVLEGGDFNWLVARYTTSGALDTTFGSGGFLRVDFENSDVVTDLVVDATGRIIVGGNTARVVSGGFIDFALARITPGGVLDTTFDTDGKVTTRINGADGITALALAPDGKLVAVGGSGFNPNAVVARYNSNGSLDGTFGVGGSRALDFGSARETASGVAVQSDGRIIVSGTTRRTFTGEDLVAVRLGIDGTIDSTFGTNGFTYVDLGGADISGGVFLESSGAVVLGASSGNSLKAVRLTSAGASDLSFGTGGVATAQFSGDTRASGIVATFDQKLIIAGEVGAERFQHGIAVARFETIAPAIPPAGAFTLSAFDYNVAETGGNATITVMRTGGSAGAVSVQYATADGTALSAGDYTASTGTLQFADGVTTQTFSVPITADTLAEGRETIRLLLSAPTGGAILNNPDEALLAIEGQGGNAGQFDASLGLTGVAQVTFPTPEAIVVDVALQPDGKFITIGRTDFVSGADSVGRDFLLARFNPDGTPDVSFGAGGVTNTDFNQTNEEPAALAILPDGKFLVVGQTVVANDPSTGGGNFAFAVSRYLPNGFLDRSFGDNGKVIDIFSGGRGASGIVALPDGKFLVAGSGFDPADPSKGGAVLVRYLADGTVDPTFGVNGTAFTTEVEEPFFNGRLNVALQADGSILLSGVGVDSSSSRDQLTVVRFTPNGALDSNFGTGGFTRLLVGVDDIETFSLKIQSDNKILVAGTASFATFDADFAVVRLNANGSLDTPFGGGDGVASVNFTTGFFNSDDEVFDMEIESTGKIVVFGRSDNFPADQLALARFNIDGTLDTSFGTDGKTLLPATPAESTAIGGLVIQPDNRLLLAASTESAVPGVHAFTVFRAFGDPAPGVFDFGASSFIVDENAGTATITIQRTKGTDGPVSVNVATSNGTAVAGEDYVATNVTVSFAAGQATQNLTIPILDNAAAEGSQSVLLTLSAPGGGAALGTQSTATLNIIDGPGQLEFSLAEYAVNEDSGTARIIVTRSGGSDGVVTASYATANGTALVGSEYLAATGTITFADGETTQSFLIPLIDDTLIEAKKTVLLSLSNVAGGATLGRAQALLNIYDQDLRDAANPGAPDRTFANGGSNSLDLGGAQFLTGAVRQLDGKIILVGETNGDFSLARFNRDGSVDTTFGTGGGLTVDLGGIDSPGDVVLQSDGKIVVTGLSIANGSSDFVTARFLANGQLDTTWGTAGVVKTDFMSNHDEAFDLAVQSDGKVVVVGSTGDPFSRDFAVLRYLGNGTLDTTFGGGDGIQLIDFDNRFDIAKGVVLQPDGKVIVAGNAEFITPGQSQTVQSGQVALTRLNSDGTLDTDFGGGDGKALESYLLVTSNSDNDVTDVLLAPDGRIVVTGELDFDAFVAKFNSDGSRDRSFGGGGQGALAAGILRGSGFFGSALTVDRAYDVTMDAEGNLLLAGSSSGQLALIRYTAAGYVDVTFGTGGKVRDPMLNNVRAVFVEPDGKILAAGTRSERSVNGFDSDFAVARYLGVTAGPKEGVVQFASLQFSVEEQASTPVATITVVRPTEQSHGRVTADYYTLDGTAVAGLDYTPVSGTVTFEDGETTKTFNVPIINDNNDTEGDQTVYLVLTNPGGGAQIGSQPVTTLVITEDDTTSGSSFSISGSSVQENAGTLTVTVSRFGNSAAFGAASLEYVTAPGTATEGEDYRPVFGTLNFAPGEASKTVVIPIISDTRIEPDETFTLQLRNPTGTTVLSSFSQSRSISILDADPTFCRNAGDLDLTFDSDGKVATSFGQSGTEEVRAIALQSDEKIVAVGQAGFNGGFGLARYNPDGTLDANFGTAGKVFLDIRGGTDAAVAVKVQSDGKILVVGTSLGDGHENQVLARFNANGTPDSAFGTNGQVNVPMAIYLNTLEEVVFQSDGKMLLGGHTYNGELGGDATVVRLNADGSVDTSFGVRGAFVYDEGGFESIDALSQLPDGTIIAASGGMRLLRLTATGRLDATFGEAGFLTLDVPGVVGTFGAMLVTGGKLLVGGDEFVEDGFLVARLSFDGVLDTTFGSGGVALAPMGTFTTTEALAVEANGRILIAGSASGDFGLARFYGDNGQRDVGFGANGRVITSVSGFSGAADLVVQGDGRIVAAGGGSDFELVRYVGGIAPGAFRFDAGEFRISEDGGSLVVTVRRVCGMDGAVSVNYATSGGTAVSGTDYTTVSGTLNWADRDVSERTITIPITDDDLAQGNLTFNLALSSPTGDAMLAAPLDQATVTIADDDAPGEFIFSATSYNAAESDGTVQITVQRINGDGGAVSVTVTGTGASATSGSDFAPVNMVLNFAANETSKTFDVALLNDTVIEPEEYFSLSLTAPTGGAAVGFRPAARVAIANEIPGPQISFAAGSFEASENDRLLVATIVRTGQTNFPASATFRVADDTAVNNFDFFGVETSVEFAPGETSKTVRVPILDDIFAEGAERAILLLENVSGAGLGANPTAILTINDNDAGEIDRTLRISDVEIIEGDTGTAQAIFTVTLSSVSGREVTVHFATANDSANSADYTAMAGDLTFAPGEVTRTIAIDVKGDTLTEIRERFSVMLSNAVGARLDDAVASGAIINDDGVAVAPSGGIQFTASTFTIVEGRPSVVLTVSRTDGDLGASTVPFSTSDGTARAGRDYLASSGNLEFAAGATSASITVPIRRDFLGEGSETFTVSLATPTAGNDVLGSVSSTTVTILDDDPNPLLDFDNDGFRDLITFKKSSFNLHRGDGTGGFGAANSIGKIAGGKSFVVGEFTGDANNDLAVLGKKALVLFTGRGDATFDAGAEFASGKAKNGLVAGDFNGDGVLDIAALAKKGVNLLMNDGTGQLAAPNTISAGARPGALLTGYFNADSNLDLVAVTGGKKPATNFLAGDGTGNFAASVSSEFPKGISVKLLASGEFNGDGNTDLVAREKKNLTLFTGTGAGMFVIAEAITEVPKGAKLLAPADLDDDLDLDLISSAAKKMAAIIVNNGDGTFATPTLTEIGFQAKMMVTTDLNLDDDPDLVLTDTKGRFKVALGAAGATLQGI